LGFVPLGKEILDFAVPRDRLDKKTVRVFVEALRSHASSVLAELPGYSVLDDTGRILA